MLLELIVPGTVHEPRIPKSHSCLAPVRWIHWQEDWLCQRRQMEDALLNPAPLRYATDGEQASLVHRRLNQVFWVVRQRRLATARYLGAESHSVRRHRKRSQGHSLRVAHRRDVLWCQQHIHHMFCMQSQKHSCGEVHGDSTFCRWY